MRAIFVLGGPGVGKTTQCIKLTKKLNFFYISVGKLLRNSNDKNIMFYIQKGELVPSKITVNLLIEKIKKSKSKTILIDGFPKNKDNLDTWNKMCGNLIDQTIVVHLVCSDILKIKRISKRSNQKRIDDKKEIIKKRLDLYHNQTIDVLNEYSKNKIIEIDASHNEEIVFKKLVNSLLIRNF